MSASLRIVTPGMGATYYSQDNYYTREGTVEASRWYGRGAEALGLSGEVDDEGFKRLLEAKDPRTGQPLKGYQRKSHAHQSGFDVTYSGPKSLSLLALVLGKKEALEAFDAAVERQMARLEKLAFTRVQHDGVRQRVQTGNLAVAGFQHDTNRLNEPLLHTHCVVLGVTQLPDGSWKSLQANTYWAMSKELNDTFMRDLEMEANKRGIETVPSAETGFWEVKGFEREHLEAFSTMSRRVKALWDFEPPSTLKALVDVGGSKAGREAHKTAVKAAIRDLTRDAELGNPARAQEVYTDHLERELWRRGFDTVRDREGHLELAPRARVALEDAGDELRWSSLEVKSKAQERVAKLDIRPPKGAHEDRSILHEQWMQKAQDIGLAPTIETLREVAEAAVGHVEVIASYTGDPKEQGVAETAASLFEWAAGVDLTPDYRLAAHAMERQVVHLVLGAAAADIQMSLDIMETAAGFLEDEEKASSWRVVARGADAMGYGEVSNVISLAERRQEREQQTRSDGMAFGDEEEAVQTSFFLDEETENASEVSNENNEVIGFVENLNDTNADVLPYSQEELAREFLEFDDNVSAVRAAIYEPIAQNQPLSEAERSFIESWDQRLGALQAEIETLDPETITSEKLEKLKERYQELDAEYQKETEQEQTEAMEIAAEPWGARKEQDFEM